MEQPTLKTDRLTVRPLVQKDAKRVQSLAGDWRVAQMAVDVPHPYEPGIGQ